MEEEKKEENMVVNNGNTVETKNVSSTLPPIRNDVSSISLDPNVKEKTIQKEETQKQEAPKKEEVKQPKKIKEKIKYNKFNTILIYIFIVVLVMTVLLCLLQFASASFSNFMWGVNNVISDLLFGMMQNITFVAKYGVTLIGVLFILSAIAEIVVSIVYKTDMKKKTLAANIITPIVIVCALMVNVNTYFTFSNASHRGINETYMKTNLKSTYTQETLEDVIDYFKNRIIIYSESFNRKNGEIEVGSDPYDLAVEDLTNLAIKYEFLKGSYPKNIHTLSEREVKKFGYPVGVTYNFTVGLDDINLSDLNKIFTITHEFCHVKGVFRESDANYCSFLAAFNSNSDVSKYAMYINIMPNLLEALESMETYYNIENEFGSICIDSGYNEICNLYAKDVNRYTAGNDTLELYTYSLDVYKNYKEELKQYLLGLNNRFNITIKDDEEDKQITLEEANKLIDEESPTRLYLVGKITEEKYNENQKYLKTISNYFPNLYLSDSEEELPDYSDFDYLKPYPNGMFATMTETDPEFGYERSVRSILEYFDKYILN